MTTDPKPDAGPLKVAAFWDGRAGHEKQTQGLIQALSRLTELSVEDIRVPGDSRAFRLQWRLLWAGSLGGRIFASASAGVKELFGRAGAGGVDLILGTGSATHAPMLLFRAAQGGRAVTCMTPDFPFSRSMDLCIVPGHDRPRPGDNVFVSLGPPNTAPAHGVHAPAQGLVLVGGADEKSHCWDSPGMVERVATLVRSAPEIQWTVSSSPRTPQAMLPLLSQACGKEGNARFIPFGETGPGWVERAYGESGRCWVTADSVSMVYEALTAGCRVGILPVAWKNPRGKIPRALAPLYERGLALSWEERARMDEPGFSPPVLDEAGRAAREILRRWWPGRWS
ncbi:MAG: mitochondrial fission ELM1 family protein [Proteobacteria bacterium]|nr:mitochondrial fission ELM1 family protein [Pseudomonadota bacterium]